jgi:hypothetical protein
LSVTIHRTYLGQITLAILIAWALCLQSVGPVLAGPVSEEDSNLVQYTLEDFGISSDDVYQGVLVSRDYGVTLPVSWDFPQDAELNLLFDHSKALHPKSSMVVDWNGTRLASIQLTSDNADDGRLDVKIPAERIKSGYNTLHVEFYMGISDDFCEDYDNPAVWAVIRKSTLLKLYEKAVTPEPDLGQFPLPFIDSSLLIDNQITLLVPDQPGNGELNAMAVIGAKLGQLSGSWRPLKLLTETYSQAANKPPKGNLIGIGTVQSLEKLGLSVSSAKANPGIGLLDEQVSPYDPDSLILMVTGKEQAEVEKAARALADSTLYARLSGQTAEILENQTVSSGLAPSGASLTFEQLGYPNSAVYGTREQKISYTIPLPALWQAKTEAKLHLHYTHSELLENKRSTLTVAVNNLPVGSVALNSENSNDAYADFNLPLSYFHTGNNYLTVLTTMQVFSNQNDADQFCTDDHMNRAWLTVEKDSSIQFPSSPDKVTTDISNFPFTFMGASDLSQFALVVPDQVSQTDLKAITTLAMTVGKIAQGEPVQPVVLPAAQAAVREEERPYQVVVGLPLKNAAIHEAKDLLPQPFDPATGLTMPIARLSAINSANVPTGYIEAYVAKNRMPRMVVTGNQEAGLLLAVDQLSDNAKVAALKGDLAITTAKDRVTTLWINKGTDQSLPATQTSRQSYSIEIWSPPDEVLYTAIVFLVITFAGLFLRMFLTLRSGVKDR